MSPSFCFDDQSQSFFQEFFCQLSLSGQTAGIHGQDLFTVAHALPLTLTTTMAPFCP
jgi:hypothetical protein